ncbi:hypothetical protein [Rhodococcus sp. OK302]|uniref:hypothetical protein n=1 Tax=Rhodococcus sp. OK302 TaxID=1882769 RepID=UPI000B9F1290|nr:hypothetical protein [Rhodococcus sp. OK302]OYD60942.1 hypothetical protein BDB13_5851 [Rhodococcus sp. OK302]
MEHRIEGRVQVVLQVQDLGKHKMSRRCDIPRTPARYTEVSGVPDTTVGHGGGALDVRVEAPVLTSMKFVQTLAGTLMFAAKIAARRKRRSTPAVG